MGEIVLRKSEKIKVETENLKKECKKRNKQNNFKFILIKDMGNLR